MLCPSVSFFNFSQPHFVAFSVCISSFCLTLFLSVLLFSDDIVNGIVFQISGLGSFIVSAHIGEGFFYIDLVFYRFAEFIS